jgi:drug/metabolite transporter (DMT)-like permease
MSILPEDGPFNVSTLMVALLAAVLFLVVVPRGPASSRWARRGWILALVACAVLFLFDTTFSGFMRTSPVGFQFAFVVVGGAVLGAGLLSGRLEGGKPTRLAAASVTASDA